jgi:WD40 repeat protein/serine/threonine protein kinase
MNPVEQGAEALDSLVGRVADEFVARLGRGEKPDVEDYAARHPEAADELRRVLRSVEVLHALTPDSAPSDAGELPHLGQLGDYRILRQVGRGGMGIVYEAEQISLRRRVALKVLPFASALDARRLQRFKNEALAVAHLDHPNIVAVLATGCERGVHFYAMRFVEGQTLADLIQSLREQAGRRTAGSKGKARPAGAAEGAGRQPSTVDEPRGGRQAPAGADTRPVAALTTEVSNASGTFVRLIANVGVQVAEGLEYAHQCGITHRDVKPANLLLDTHGAVCISDFGLAHVGTDGNLTMTGDLLGTLRYMSPEQVMAQRVPVDHRTDIYSLGVTLYELLTLQPPFDGRDRQEVLRQIAFDEPVPPRRRNRAVPADLETIVQKAMAKNPAERYPTARALADDLKRFLADQPIQARRPGPVQRLAKWARRHRAVVTTAAATLVLALAATTGLVWAERNRTAAAYEGERQQHRRAEENLQEAERQKQAAEGQKQLADQRRDEAERQRDRAQQLQLLAEQRELAARQNLYAAQLVLVQHAWERRHIGRMIELLEAQRAPEGPDLRGFEWYYWWNQCQGGRSTLQPPGEPVFASALAPDGRTLATGGPAGTIKLWDVPGRRLSSKLSWPGATVIALAFAPDGKTLAAAADLGRSDGGRIRLWDLASGQDTRTFGPPGFEVLSLAYSPDGKVLALGEVKALATFPSPGEVTLWDAAEGRKLRTCGRDLETVSGVAFSPDGKTLAGVNGAHVSPYGSGTGGTPALRLWDPATSQEKASLVFDDFPASSVAFSPDGKTVAVGGLGAVKLCEAATAKEQATLPAGPGMVWSLAFSPDGKTLATANDDDTVRFWDMAARAPFASRWHRSVTSVAYGPDGRTVASAGGGAVELWTVPRGEGPAAWARHGGWVTALAFAADGKRLVSGSYDGTAKAGDFQAAALDKPLAAFGSGPHARIRAMALSPDGTRLATGGDQLDLWDVATGLRRAALKGHATWVMSAAFAPGGDLLVTADADGVLKLWDGHTGAELATFQVYPPMRPVGPTAGDRTEWNGGANYVTGLAFSPDGKVLVAAGSKGVKLWDVRTRRPLPGLKQDTTCHLFCTFSRDGTLLATARGMVLGIGGATGGGGNDITLWDPATGMVRAVLSAHGFTPASLAFSPDGKTLATGGSDGQIMLWSVAARQELATLPGHDGSVVAVAFDPSGQVLASGGGDGAVRLWYAPRADAPRPKNP